MDASIDFSGILKGSIADGGGGGGGDTVIITPLVTSGTKIADVSVNGVEKDLYCPTPPTPTEVDITPVVTSGTKIADVSVGGVEKDLYAPDYGADITALDGRLDTAEYNITDIKQSLSQLDGLAIYKQVIPIGDTASFIANDSMPIIKLTANIEPQQDLHGYDAPWVGGAGKNKLNPNIRKYGSPYAVWGGELSSNTPNGDLTLDAGTYTFSMNESVKQINVRDNPDSVIVRVYSTNAMTFTIDQRKAVKIAIELRSGQDINNLNFQLESGSTATAWQPYSNICPISGWSDINVSLSPTLEAQDATIYTTNFVDSGNPLTVYGGYIDAISGLLTVTDVNIASYAGEALPSTWISDRDVYTSGGTPTTGAQVVYKLASALNYQLTAQQINVLIGQNYIWADTGSIKEVGYLDILHLS